VAVVRRGFAPQRRSYAQMNMGIAVDIYGGLAQPIAPRRRGAEPPLL